MWIESVKSRVSKGYKNNVTQKVLTKINFYFIYNNNCIAAPVPWYKLLYLAQVYKAINTFSWKCEHITWSNSQSILTIGTAVHWNSKTDSILGNFKAVSKYSTCGWIWNQMCLKFSWKLDLIAMLILVSLTKPQFALWRTEFIEQLTCFKISSDWKINTLACVL